MSNLLNNLNKEQVEAVTHNDGPLMIVAGAGTGKTTVITRRIAWLIEQGLAKPENILALTFTDKAATEMEERVDMLLPLGYVDIQISTFHSFCEQLLRNYGAEIGLCRDFKILSELNVWLLTRQNYNQFNLDYYKPLSNPTKFIRSLLTHFSKLKDGVITPEIYSDFVKQKTSLIKSNIDEDLKIELSRLEELSSAYKTYQEILLENNSLDFGDLILYSILLFKDRPNILKKASEQYKYILVDEFQDTNIAQYELIKLLTKYNNNITVVGDDDQAIYKFRGASVENVINFELDFTKTKKVVLSKNYRSAQCILDQAYKFIQANNPDRLEAKYNEITKKLKAQTKDPGEIQHIHSATNEEEIKKVINKIIELKKTHNAVWNDFAILVRSNAAGKDFANALEKQSLPYQFLALSGLYKKPVVLDVIALMKVIDDPYDSTSVYRMLNLDIVNLHPMTIAKLNMQARTKGKPLFDILKNCPPEDFANKEEANRIAALLNVGDKIRSIAAKENASEILIKIIRETGYLNYLNNLDESLKHDAFRCLQKFFERIKSFETRNDKATLHAFLSEFSDERDAGEEGSFSIDPDAGPDMIRILTIHSSKGLEFKYVFIVNLVEKRFPSQRRSEPIPIPSGLLHNSETTTEQHIQEERRLLYVAITRAKKGVYLTSADNYGGVRKRKPSRFLSELNYDITETTETNIQNIINDKKIITDEVKKIHITLPKQFSFTQLSSFKLCPLQYKFAYVFKIPLSGKWTFSYGKTMHNTLEDYFKLWIERSATKTQSIPVSIKEMLEIYKNRWEDDWYINDEQREKYRTKGEKELKTYYKSLKDDLPKPISIEQNFKLKIDNIILKGRIDRIDTYEDGVEIIDYKTGTPKLKNKLKRADKEQLYLYQIAANEILGLNTKKLTLHYLEDNSKVSFIASDKELINLKNDIIERVDRIRSSDFNATPGFHCGYCDFANICEFRQT